MIHILLSFLTNTHFIIITILMTEILVL